MKFVKFVCVSVMALMLLSGLGIATEINGSGGSSHLPINSAGIPYITPGTAFNVKPLNVGNQPGSDAGYVKYVLDLVNNTVLNQNVKNVISGSSPFGATFDPANGFVYVVNELTCNVLVINGSTNSVIKSIKVGGYPIEAAFDPANGYVYVTIY